MAMAPGRNTDTPECSSCSSFCRFLVAVVGVQELPLPLLSVRRQVPPRPHQRAGKRRILMVQEPGPLAADHAAAVEPTAKPVSTARYSR